MTVSLASLQKLMTLKLSTEQMEGVIEVLAVELAPLEERLMADELRRSKDRARKVPSSSTEIPRKPDGNSTETAVSRVEDISSLSLPSKEDLDNLSLSLSKPPCLNPRATGTNPRALGTNPRAIAQEPEDFKAFMAVYPKRKSQTDRKAALKAFGPALKRVDFETLIHAAKAYNAEMTATGKIGTEFVKQARTWLNGDCWNDYQYTSKANGGSEVVQVPVFDGTPAMHEWTLHLGKRPFITDIHVPGAQVRRGAWFPTEYPPTQKEQAA